jgi:hypothetical protein
MDAEPSGPKVRRRIIARSVCCWSGNELQLYAMPVLTVRLSDEEKKILTRRSRQAGMKRATFVRQLIRAQPYATATDLLEDLQKEWGNEQLRVARSRRK